MKLFIVWKDGKEDDIVNVHSYSATGSTVAIMFEDGKTMMISANAFKTITEVD